MKNPEVGDSIRFTTELMAVKLQHPNISGRHIIVVPAKYYRKARPEFVAEGEEDIPISPRDIFTVMSMKFESMGWKIIAQRSFDKMVIGFYLRTVEAQPEQYMEVVKT